MRHTRLQYPHATASIIQQATLAALKNHTTLRAEIGRACGRWMSKHQHCSIADVMVIGHNLKRIGVMEEA